MREKPAKGNQRGYVEITATTYKIEHDATGAVIKPNGTTRLKARDVYSNRTRNRLDQIRWQREHGRS